MKKSVNKSIKDIFPGIMILDNEPVSVQNPFSGESCVLSPEEVAVYDYLKGCELIGDHKGLRKGLDWFIDNNSHAYITLLD
jgi:hypothetical protein